MDDDVFRYDNAAQDKPTNETGEIVKAYDQGQALPTVLVFANGRLRELHKTLKEDCVLEPVSLGESIDVYKRQPYSGSYGGNHQQTDPCFQTAASGAGT